MSSASPTTPLSSSALADTNTPVGFPVRMHSLPYAAFRHKQGEIHRVKRGRPASWPTSVGLSSGVTMNPGSKNAALPALPGPDGVLPAALRDRWRDESVGSVWLRPADWYHPAVDALDPESGLPSRQYLAIRLAETYRDAALPTQRARTVADLRHHLVLVDVAVGTVDPFTRAARSAAVGAALTTTYGEGHPMAT